jgi:hypothetical protein
VRRRSGIALLTGLLLAAATAGCDGRALGAFQRNGARAEPLVWTALDPAGVGMQEDPSRRIARFLIDVPAAVGAGPLRQLELCFAQPLDGARVDADAMGARHAVTLLQGKRAGGATVLIPLAPLPLDRIEVTVHHHLRPAPLLQELRLGRARAPTPRAPNNDEDGGAASGERR